MSTPDTKEVKKLKIDMAQTFKDFELDVGDCSMLQNHYANIMADTPLLLQIAEIHSRNLDDAYKDCKKAIVILGNRIKYLQAETAKAKSK